MAHSNQGISKPRPVQSKAQRRPCCLHPSGAPTHLLLSLQEVASQEESFMPDISSYIWERVKQQFTPFPHCIKKTQHRHSRTLSIIMDHGISESMLIVLLHYTITMVKLPLGRVFLPTVLLHRTDGEKECAPHSFSPPYRWGERVSPPLFHPTVQMGRKSMVRRLPHQRFLP